MVEPRRPHCSIRGLCTANGTNLAKGRLTSSVSTSFGQVGFHEGFNSAPPGGFASKAIRLCATSLAFARPTPIRISGIPIGGLPGFTIRNSRFPNVTRGIFLHGVVLWLDLSSFSCRPEVDQLRVNDFGLAEETPDNISVATPLEQVSHNFPPDPIPQGGGVARIRLWYASSPKRIAEGGAVVVDTWLAFGLHSLTAQPVAAARFTVEVVQGDGGAKFSLRDWVLASPDHSQLSGHLHYSMRTSWVAPAGLH